MDIFMRFLWAFVVGGAFCVVAQILIDKTNLTPARILVLYVVVGVILGGVGLYEPIVNFAGAGATTPLTGFGYLISNGVKKARKYPFDYLARPRVDLTRRRKMRRLILRADMSAVCRSFWASFVCVPAFLWVRCSHSHSLFSLRCSYGT